MYDATSDSGQLLRRREHSSKDAQAQLPQLLGGQLAIVQVVQVQAFEPTHRESAISAIMLCQRHPGNQIVVGRACARTMAAFAAASPR